MTTRESQASDDLTPLTQPEGVRPMKARQCSATARRTESRCRNAPILGGTVCHKHGGAAPQVRNAARRRLVTSEAAALVAQYEHRPLESPEEALLTIGAETVAIVGALRARVAELDTLTVTDRTGAENVAAVLGAYERALDRAGRLLVSINRLNLDERQRTVRSEQVAILAGILRRAVYDPRTGLDYEAGQEVLAAFMDEWRQAEARGEVVAA
jgi:hypothetical protein